MFLIVLILSNLGYTFTFTAMGDTGKGNDGQWEVSRALKQVCETRNCKFNLLLGDNIYQEGVTSVDDPQFYEKFEKQYGDITMPFYVALGNHDYGELEDHWERGGYEIAYAAKNPQWILPKEYYYFEMNEVLFIVLDTVLLKHNKKVKEQAAMVKEALTNSKAKWVIVAAHHPYLSNGKHGNAGKYEGLPFPYKVSGKYIKDFMDKNLCGKMDILFSGHDHNKQILPGTKKCDATFVVSGAGASATALKERNPFYVQSEELGFILADVTNDKISLEVINSLGNTTHTHVVKKH
ncbi:MAG: metallophosphoesterase [Bdellovibrionales bacterium]|nr:metallophosphoesterase [Bdellovibrionales bacterium]